MPILKVYDESAQQWVGITSLKGEKGIQGAQGSQGPQGETGYGTPSGGNTNEVLMKASNNDYDFTWRQMSKSFSITLDSTAWIDSSLTAVNADFQATGYVYLIAPLSTSFASYGSAGVYADDVTTDNQMVFHCSKTVDSDLVVNVVRLIV